MVIVRLSVESRLSLNGLFCISSRPTVYSRPTTGWCKTDDQPLKLSVDEKNPEWLYFFNHPTKNNIQNRAKILADCRPTIGRFGVESTSFPLTVRKVWFWPTFTSLSPDRMMLQIRFLFCRLSQRYACLKVSHTHGRTYVGWSLILCLYNEAQTHSILISNNEDPLHLTFIKTVFFFVLHLKIDCGYTSEPPHSTLCFRQK